MNKLITVLLLLTVVPGCFDKLNVEHADVGFDLSADGKQIVFSSAEGDLFLLELDSEKVTRLTETDQIETRPSFSPDGKSIVCAYSDDDRNSFGILKLDVATKAIEQLTKPGEFSDMVPRFSSDGKQIVFARAHRHRPYSMGGMIWDKWDVYSLVLDGRSVTRLTRQEYPEISRVSQRSDGTLFYSADTFADGKLQTQLYVLETNGIPVAYIPAGFKSNRSRGTAFYEPVLSRDDTKLAYVCDSNKPFFYDIHVASFEPQKDKTWFHADDSARINGSPVLAPDGKSLFFLCGTSSNLGNRPIFSLLKTDQKGLASKIASEEMLTDPQPWLSTPTTN
ncbi:hypothetical protein GC197_12515 [bacterium]|nr:hypothetical protein [bacterium]